MPTSLPGLGDLLIEFTNALYQGDQPLHTTADTYRYCPHCRNSLSISSVYYNNWCKSTPKGRAFPIPVDWCRAMVVVCLRSQQPCMGLLFVVAFVRLLLISELLDMSVGQVSFLGSTKCHFTSADSKGNCCHEGCRNYHIAP